jgi:hypothetical protein
MAQTTIWQVAEGSSGLTMREAVNDQVAALVSNSSGSTAPSLTVAGQWWFDTSTTPGVMKQRNVTNDGWVAPLVPTDVSTDTDFANDAAKLATRATISTFTKRANGSAKFWFAYNQTGTAVVDGSYNIASMTDQGVGKFTFTLTNNMANANWSAIFSAGQKSTRNVRVLTGDGADKTKATSGWGAGNANVSGTYQDDDALGGSGLGDLA